MLVIAFSLACVKMLSPWQLGKHAAEQQHDQRWRAPPSSARSRSVTWFRPGSCSPPDDEYRTVSLTGHYLGAVQIPMRQRPTSAGLGDQLVTEFPAVRLRPGGAGQPGMLDADSSGTQQPPALPAGELALIGQAAAARGYRAV